MQEPTEKDIKEWKSLYEEYKPLLHPNAKPTIEVLEYLKKKYPLKEENSELYRDVVVSNIKMNKYLASKIPDGKELIPIVFTIPNQGNASALYDTRHEVYKGTIIILGVELETGHFIVEGSDDEVTAIKGLDAKDLRNYYLVANYVRCLKKHDMLNEVLKWSREGQ